MKKLIAVVLMFVLLISFTVVVMADPNDTAVGDGVTFGSYPQAADGKESTPIEWIVLEKKNDKALLISKEGLHMKLYNDSKKNVTWETCTLRAWLNNEFLKKAFTKKERKVILVTKVDNSQAQCYSQWKTNGGKDTKDRIYLLSYAEAKKYYKIKKDDKENMKPRIPPTAYAVKKTKAFASKRFFTKEGYAGTWWWLRSPGEKQNQAAYVDSSGEFLCNDVNFGHPVIRPVLWVDLDTEFF